MARNDRVSRINFGNFRGKGRGLKRAFELNVLRIRRLGFCRPVLQGRGRPFWFWKVPAQGSPGQMSINVHFFETRIWMRRDIKG